MIVGTSPKGVGVLPKSVGMIPEGSGDGPVIIGDIYYAQAGFLIGEICTT